MCFNVGTDYLHPSYWAGSNQSLEASILSKRTITPLPVNNYILFFFTIIIIPEHVLCTANDSCIICSLLAKVVIIWISKKTSMADPGFDPRGWFLHFLYTLACAHIELRQRFCVPMCTYFLVTLCSALLGERAIIRMCKETTGQRCAPD